MPGRTNHRGWIVLESIASMDGMLCVDFFEHPDGGYGFEHLRTDPEDRGRWTAVGSFGGSRFPSPSDAADAATAAVSWLTSETQASDRLESWLRSNSDSDD